MRDITLEDTFYHLFSTRQFSTGAPFTLAGTPVVSAYENDSVTQITAGITLGVDHDGVTGLNLLTIVATAANGYESGKDYSLVITTGTVDSVSAVGEVIGQFSIGRSAAAVDLANATDGLGALKTLIDTVDTVVDGIQTDLDNGTDGLGAIKTDTAAILVDTGTAGVLLAATATSAQLVDDIWDEDVDTSHQTAGTAGKKLDDSGAAADPWATALPGAYGAGTAGKIVGDNVDAPISTVDTVVDAIKAVTDLLPNAGALSDLATILVDTNELQGDWTDGGRLDLLLDAIKAITDLLTLAAINAEVDTALTDYDALVPADLPTNFGSMGIEADGHVHADVKEVNGNSTAAVNMALVADAMLPGTVDNTVAPTSTVFECDDITDAEADQYIGRTIVFTSGTLNRQACSITDYALVSGRGRFTVSELTQAPSNNDTLVII